MSTASLDSAVPPNSSEPPTTGGDVLVVGEALVDIVRTTTGQVTEHVGGSPANVALTLARLGRPTRLLTRVGDDERGRRVAAHLGASGVILAAGSVVSQATSTAAAQLDEAGAASYTFDLLWDLPDGSAADPGDGVGDGADDGVGDEADPPRCVHTGSIAAVLEPGSTKVRALFTAARTTSTTSYDPNLRPALMGSPEAVRPVVEALVAAADVVKLSDEDAAWLDPDTTPDELAAGWSALGPAVVVVTRGGDGAKAWCAAGVVGVPGRRVQVADTVGAGDSFSGGLIDALWSRDLLGADRREQLRAIDSLTLGEVLEHAIAVSAITVSRPGADPPTREELGIGGPLHRAGEH